MYESAEARNGLLLSSTQRLLNVALDLLFPPRCVGCGRVDYVWCERCQAEINAIPFRTDINTLEPLTASAATGIHEGKLREAVQALKYENVRAIASPRACRTRPRDNW